MTRSISAKFLAGASTWPDATAWPNFSAWLTNPTAVSVLNTFSRPAVTVHTTNHAVGTMVTQAYRVRFILNSTTVHSVSAMAASIWLAVPNSGHMVQMPPSGSITPVYRKEPHSAHARAEPMMLLVQDLVSLKAGIALPTRSWIMKRQTRVPASTVVRMNSASNRMAKWYQIPMSALPPRNPDRMVAMPTASVGAPPVRDMSVVSPTSCAIWVSMSGVTAKPQAEITWAAWSAVVPISAAELFMAK